MARKAFDQSVAWIFAIFGATSLFGAAGTAIFYFYMEPGAVSMKMSAKPLERHSSADKLITSTEKSKEPMWSYEGDEGPANWADLSKEWISCRDGKQQSPVDFQEVSLSPAPTPIKFHYRTASVGLIRKPHELGIEFKPGQTLSSKGKEYQLTDMAFHTPSEHTVFGEHYPMEIQLKHSAANGQVTMLSMLVKGGSHNPALDPVWNHFTKEALKGQPIAIAAFNVGALMSQSSQYYSYSGSLTTPPCSEGVNWVVMKNPIEASVQQLLEIAAVIKKNARPLQQLNGRETTLKGYDIGNQQAGLAH